MDIVREFEQYCDKNNIQFEYGSNDHLNLIESSNLPSQIFLLMFPPKRKSVISSNKMNITGNIFNGKFMLLVPSDYANHYFTENNADQLNSKYTKNIEPLIEIHRQLGLCLMKCGNLDVNLWENIDAVNALDANKDGLWCDYSIQTV